MKDLKPYLRHAANCMAGLSGIPRPCTCGLEAVERAIDDAVLQATRYRYVRSMQPDVLEHLAHTAASDDDFDAKIDEFRCP